MIISPAKRLDGVTTYYFAKKLAEIDDMNKDGKAYVINLGIGSPDLMPPSEVVEKLIATTHESDAHKYQSYKGIPTLRNAISQWYHSHFDVTVHADEQVLPLLGSKEGVMHISMSFLNPGDEVLIPNPGYPSYSMCTLLAGGIPIDMPLCEHLGWKPDLDTLDKMDLSKVKLMWVNYPNMPTGAKAGLSFFNDLVAFSKKHKILICHDNPYAFILNDYPLSIFNAEGANDCAIELISLSKCYNMAGWRVGAVIGAKPYIDTIMTFKSNMDSGMFKPIQEAASIALAIKQSWIDGLNQVYQERKQAAFRIMDVLGLTYDYNSAGLFVWGKILDSSFDADKLADKLLYENRVFITPGHIFGNQGNQYLRISLCSPVSEMEAALYRIQTGFNSSNIE
ncbi:MAG: aminotransferase class I/II-fold pyridoxal phosphate-dependent enzyme [Saprospiraceae bacterium]|nr:aminotransferase class I/II-fold pyridoxal phosphate-dependent enzyme [Saprospiraceae bacterium]